MPESAVPDDEDRWAEERGRFLSSNEIGLRDRVAQAVAYCELGFSASGISKKLETTKSTVDKYLRIAEKTYPGITTRTVLDFGGEVDAGIDGIEPPAERECPVCLRESVLTPQGADEVFMTSSWGSGAMLDDAELVCSFCFSARIDGQWQRMKSADSRAWELSQSGNKSNTEYREILTSGIDTGKPKPTADDAEGW